MIELDTIDYHKPVKLTNNIHRLTSRNPSQMTGPGTNTYIIGRFELCSSRSGTSIRISRP